MDRLRIRIWSDNFDKFLVRGNGKIETIFSIGTVNHRARYGFLDSRHGIINAETKMLAGRDRGRDRV